MARKSKYNDKLVADIVALLEDGNTDADTIALVGIGHDTFYSWINNKPEFSEAVTHARGIARQRAVEAWQKALNVTQQKTGKSVTFTETRLNRNGEPYEYTRTTNEKSVTELAPDWRAAESYLKRRDPANWAETYIIKVSPEDAAILKEMGKSPGDAFEELMNKIKAAKNA